MKKYMFELIFPAKFIFMETYRVLLFENFVLTYLTIVGLNERGTGSQ